MRDDPLTGRIIRHQLTMAERERVITRIGERMVREDHVLFAYLFGSFLEDRPFGDVDLAVFVDDS